jgi:dipeptide/tripeptide permease
VISLGAIVTATRSAWLRKYIFAEVGFTTTAVKLLASFWHFLHTFNENFWADRVKQISHHLVGSYHRRLSGTFCTHAHHTSHMHHALQNAE